MDAAALSQLLAAARSDGPTRVAARRAAEDRARSLLDLAAGSMGGHDLRELLELCAADLVDGEPRPARLPGSFRGAGLREIVGRPGVANGWIGRLWHHRDEVARATADEMLLDPDARGLPTSDPALPTMLLYLRDRSRYVPCNAALARGAAAIGAVADQDPPRGIEAYDDWCRAVRAFGAAHGLDDQELDALLAAADPGVPTPPGGADAAPPTRTRARTRAERRTSAHRPADAARRPRRAPSAAERPHRLCTVCFLQRPLEQFEGDGTVCRDCR